LVKVFAPSSHPETASLFFSLLTKYLTDLDLKIAK